MSERNKKKKERDINRMCRFSAEPRRKRKKSSSDNFAWPLVSAHQSRLLDSLLAPSLLVAPIEPYLRPYLERNTHSNVAPCTGNLLIARCIRCEWLLFACSPLFIAAKHLNVITCSTPYFAFISEQNLASLLHLS